MKMHPELKKHPKYFEKKIVKLADNVYQAFGFAASNVYMIIGNNGLIIIDTSESTEAAKNILQRFRKITNLPVKTIIYTHSHRDHVSGANVFAQKNTQIIASEKYSDDSLIVASKHPRPTVAMQKRTKRQFGIGLKYPTEIIGIGIGPGDRPLKGLGQGSLKPTKTINKNKKITTCGIKLSLVNAPGETPDHIVVWYEDKKILFCGDNYYRAFPNLYPIRGSIYRDFDAWADSLNLLTEFNAEILAPGHTKIIKGKKQIKKILEEYRDAILHVINETRNGMDKGLTIDQLATNIKLPKKLANKPHLREFYGRVDWSVRAYCVGTMGWFDGNPTSLGTLSPKEEATRFIKLTGGVNKMLAEIKNARKKRDYQWALQLVDRLIYANIQTKHANKMKAEILKEHAQNQINCTARHYYLEYAKEL